MGEGRPGIAQAGRVCRGVAVEDVGGEQRPHSAW